MPKYTFRQLINTLKKPSKPVISESYCPSPLPDVEMITQYGLRPLTSAERGLFPGLHLVLRIDKVRLTQPPAAVPLARDGWM